jgi:hypothetical protein
VLLALFAIAFAGALAMPEPVSSRGRARLTPQRPSVPRGGAAPVPPAALGRHLVVVDRRSVLLARPAVLGEPVPQQRPSGRGVGVFVLAGSAAVAQLVFGPAVPWAGAVAARSRCQSGC